MSSGGDTGNSKKTVKRKAPPLAYKKGQSGNPNGRPKRTPEELDLIAACKAKTPQALDTILQIMESGENEKNRLAAAQSIIERGYGKAVQQIEMDGRLTVRTLAEELAELNKQQGG